MNKLVFQYPYVYLWGMYTGSTAWYMDDLALRCLNCGYPSDTIFLGGPDMAPVSIKTVNNLAFWDWLKNTYPLMAEPYDSIIYELQYKEDMK